MPDSSAFSDGAKDKCGVVGVAIGSKDVAVSVFQSLRALQHRGQESAGIATHDYSYPRYIQLKGGMGLVHEVFDSKSLGGFTGQIGIGHVRYSTSGSSNVINIQPMKKGTINGDIALAHNGDIVNAEDLRNELSSKGIEFMTTSDSEVILKLIANNIDNEMEVVQSIRSVMNYLRGSYCLTIIAEGRLFAVRDPHGIRPLSIGKLEGGYAVASESVAFNALGGVLLRDVEPGEIVEISRTGIRSYSTIERKRKAHCMFEYVYFARPDSIIDGRQVYDVRVKIGKILAVEQPVDAEVIIPVPDSGRAHALGYSIGSQIPFAEGLIKNRYIARTFIMPSGRKSQVTHKLNVVRSVVEGKSVCLVDDSIVRGNTMGRIVKLLRNFGASKVHIRVGSPPLMWPCYMGVDMKSRSEFIARKAAETETTMDGLYDRISELIGADSVGYLSIDGLMRAIGMPHEDLCIGCLTGRYPVQVPGEKVRTDNVDEDIDWLSHYDERGRFEDYDSDSIDSRKC